MQRNMLGFQDWETDPKLPRLADWYLNIMSPADIRFGGSRNNIVDGDSEPCDGRHAARGDGNGLCRTHIRLFPNN